MRDKKPIISFIITVYNNEKYVKNAVQSIMSQNHEEIELILIDDGSTDRTPQILDEIGLKYDNVTVIHQKNQWIYASFNNGIRAAKGEYIYILNSDDKLAPGAVQLLLDKVVEYDRPDVIWTKVLCHKCDAEKNILQADVNQWDKLICEEKYYPKVEEVRENWTFFIDCRAAQNQANLYKRSLALRFPFRNDIYGADTFFNIQIASEVKSAALLKEPIYEFFIYGNKEMNASCGKYYGYEHEMFNEEYESYAALFQSWGMEESVYLFSLKRRRLKNVTSEITTLLSPQCKMSVNEKLETILTKYVDETILFCGAGESREELESRVLSGMRNILVKEEITPKESMYFVYELLESLLRYEKEKEDLEKIRNAVWHPLNPHHIGECFYRKLVSSTIT